MSAAERQTARATELKTYSPEDRPLAIQAGREAATPSMEFISTRSLAEPLDLNQLGQIISREDIPWLDRRRLIRQQLQAVYDVRQSQLDAARTVSRTVTEATERLAIGEIALYREQKGLELRIRFQQMMQDVGRQVELSDLEFLAEFGEDVTHFEEKLQGRHIAARFKQTIQTRIDRAFETVADRMLEVATGKPSPMPVIR